MLRSIMFAALIALATTNAANAQQVTSWDAWVANTRSLVPKNEQGISDGIEYRDKICPAQPVDKQEACKAQAEKFIAYRRIAKQLAETMLDAFDSKLAESRQIATSVNPIYQQVNKLGTDAGNLLDQLYPRRQASVQ